MKIKSILRRLCAFTIAVATVSTSIIYAPEIVEASNQYYVKFIDNITHNEDRTATLLEGETIKTTTKMPENYKYLNPPFEVKGTSKDNSPIDVTPEGNITAKPLKDNADSMVLYTVEPVFSAFLTKSDTGVAACKVNSSGPLPDLKTLALEAEVLNNRDISITEQSNLTLKVSENQTDPKGGYLSFGAVEATGGLDEFSGAIATFKKREGDYITVEITKEGRKLELKLKSAFPDMMLKDTTFSLTFALQTLGDLQLTVISKKKAVDTIATDIGAAANFKDFFKLESTDSQFAITRRFNVVHTERRYNNKNGFKIDWEWLPDNPADKTVVKIVGDRADDTWLVTPYPKLDNVTGKLQATVSYDDKNVSTLKSAVPITILGTGTYPKLNAIYSYTGDKATGGKPVEIKDGIPPSKMDVNNGEFADYEGKAPFKFTGELQYGTGLGKAENIKIEFNNAYSGKVDVFIDNSTSVYVPGTMLPAPNESKREGTRAITVKAAQEGLCVMKVYYYNKSGQPYNNSPKVFNIDIEDSSPRKDPTLKSLKMVGKPVTVSEEYSAHFYEIYQDGIIDFGFNLDENKRIYDITVPWAVEEINLTPLYKAIGKLKTNPVTVKWNAGKDETILSGDGSDKATTPQIKLPENGIQTVFVNGVAEDGITFSRYELRITRAPKSDVASLKSLTVKTTKDDKERELTPAFNPEKYEYSLSLPYAYRGDEAAIIRAVSVGDWGERPEFTFEPVKKLNLWQMIQKIFSNKNESKMDLRYEIDEKTDEIKSLNTVKITVKSEDEKKTVTYTVNIKIEDPSQNNLLSDFKVFEMGNDKPMPFYNNQKFSKDGSKDYYLEIPYKTQELRFELLPDDDKAQKIRTFHPDIYKTDINPEEKMYNKKGSPISVKVKVPPLEDYQKTKTFDYKFEVQAESDKWTGETSEPYILHITRTEPSTDSRLESMTVADTANDKLVDTFRFSKQKTEYAFEVPFTTEEVVVSPVAVKPDLTTVTVDDTKISKSMTGKIIKLKAGTTTKVTVLVLPEAGKDFQTIYTLNITRKAPSTEARLQKLNVTGGEDMTPAPFVPSNTSYTVSIPQGTESYTISAIPVDSKATIKINGKEVVNGSPSEPITSADPYSKIPIVVTAEDGKTTMNYTLTVKDYNLIKKSSNADLYDLKVEYADLAPKFKSNIYEYELYVKPETNFLDITPVLANNNATMEVSVGSKKLTSYDGTYSSSLFVNKTTFTINVKAEDGQTEKTYTVNVFRNDKNKQGAFKPITAEMVDYSQNPIVIDITNYAVIDASVFNKLKTDYKDKSIIFKGNDYMLKITGRDIKDLVPHTQQYDLYFSFTTPEEQLIEDLLYSNEYDWQLEPVYIYFNDHGPLPGKMILTINLGHEYKNNQLFWNYYNTERKRIDYYGYVNSNAKGTFTVPITHMSTYMVAKNKVKVAEDKTGSGFGTVDTSSGGSPSGASQNANSSTTKGKGNPKTGSNPAIMPRRRTGGCR